MSSDENDERRDLCCSMDDESTCSTVAGKGLSDTAISKPPCTVQAAAAISCEDVEHTVTGEGDEATVGTLSEECMVNISSELRAGNAMLPRK